MLTDARSLARQLGNSATAAAIAAIGPPGDNDAMDADPTAGAVNQPDEPLLVPSAPTRQRRILLGAALVGLVLAAGLPQIDAPWLPGDEYIFLVRNPDVNPLADPVGTSRPLSERLWRLATSVHEDLYQPLPMMAYAVEWELTGGSSAAAHRTDLVLHALNALLMWWVVAGLLRRWGGGANESTCVAVAWAAAVVWALHPALATAYAADMGRTHLLSAMFLLLATGGLLRMLDRERDELLWVVLTLGALVLAMLSKVAPGWLLPAAVVYAMRRGWRRTLLAPWIWGVAAICAGFALLTLRTSASAGLIEDASKGLFGDPVARSSLAVWIYARDLAWPRLLAYWHPPDPRTAWTYPLVWVGLVLGVMSAAHAILAWRAPARRLATVGWAWTWGMLLPVIGLVGAREAAAVDRYLYQPLIGVLIVIAALAIRSRGVQRRPNLPIVAGVVAGVGLLLLTLPEVHIARSPLLRAERLVALDPGDPRADEALAAAYDFARDKPLPREDIARVPADATQYEYFTGQTIDALRAAADCPNLEHFFPGVDDRAPFHRRLSYRFLMAGQPDLALAQAELARSLDPDAYNTWRRLAQAHRALGAYADAAADYERCEALLPDDPLTRRVHYAEFGDLLMTQLGRDADACRRFEQAMSVPQPPAWTDAAAWYDATMQAMLGVARCQIRYGHGATGFDIVRDILKRDPTLTAAWLIAGEYHLRSQHLPQAIAAYSEVVHNHPTHYEALRGLHESLLQADQIKDAAAAWRTAGQLAPQRIEFASFYVWAAALAADPAAVTAADRLLAVEPDSPFACFAHMLFAIRGGDLRAALDWVERATHGRPAPQAREFERAAAALKLLRQRGQLPPESLAVEAQVVVMGPFSVAAHRAALEELSVARGSDWYAGVKEAADGVLRRLSDVIARETQEK